MVFGRGLTGARKYIRRTCANYRWVLDFSALSWQHSCLFLTQTVLRPRCALVMYPKRASHGMIFSCSDIPTEKEGI